jgi:hypothetical protein
VDRRQPEDRHLARSRQQRVGQPHHHGCGYISENQFGTNTPTPNASNYADMEGLVARPATALNDYGGGNDDDDSGSLIRYVLAALRRQGRRRSNNELNGLSLGGIGRDTDITTSRS